MPIPQSLSHYLESQLISVQYNYRMYNLQFLSHHQELLLIEDVRNLVFASSFISTICVLNGRRVMPRILKKPKKDKYLTSLTLLNYSRIRKMQSICAFLTVFVLWSIPLVCVYDFCEYYCTY